MHKTDLMSLLTAVWQSQTEYLPIFLLHVYNTALPFLNDLIYQISRTEGWRRKQEMSSRVLV